MGFRERFKRDDDGDDGDDGDSVNKEPTTVGDLTIALADPEAPEPVYTGATDSPSAADALNELLIATDTDTAASAATLPAAAAPAPSPTSATSEEVLRQAPSEHAPAPSPESDAAREALVRPRLASWQTAALGSPKKADEDRLFEEAALGRFERKAAPHLATPPIITPATPPPAAAAAAAAPAAAAAAAAAAPAPAPAAAAPTAHDVVAGPVAGSQPSAHSAPDVASLSAPAAPTSSATPSLDGGAPDSKNALVDDFDIDDETAAEDADDSDRALARRASKLLERGDLSPDDPEVVHLLEVVNSSGERARPGELVDLTRLPASERTRLIIRVLCGLVAELPVDDAPLETEDAGQESEAATA